MLLAKPPGQHDEVFNDLDNNLMTFWQVIRDQGEALHNRLDSLLYSRKQYYDWYHSLFDGSEMEPLERATRYFYCLRSTGTGWLRQSPVGWNSEPKNMYSYYHALERFEAVQNRFRHRVLIDNRNVLDTIKRYDGPNTFFYIDGPYIGTEHYYQASKKGFPHQQMAELLQTIQGKAAVSYYPHVNLDLWYTDWRRHTWFTHKQSQIQLPTREEDTAVELLLCNYEEAPKPKPKTEFPKPQALTLW